MTPVDAAKAFAAAAALLMLSACSLTAPNSTAPALVIVRPPESIDPVKDVSGGKTYDIGGKPATVFAPGDAIVVCRRQTFEHDAKITVQRFAIAVKTDTPFPAPVRVDFGVAINFVRKGTSELCYQQMLPEKMATGQYEARVIFSFPVRADVEYVMQMPGVPFTVAPIRSR